MKWYSSAVRAVVLSLVLLGAAPVGAGAEDPRLFIANLGTQGMQVLAPQIPMGQRIARFRELFQANFDVAGIGRFVLGRYWWSLTPYQQQEYLALFQEYTVRAYAARLGQYGGSPFRVIGSRPSDGETVVASEVPRPDGRLTRIDWYLIAPGGRYKVADVHVDGISMKITQRDYFDWIIQNNAGRADVILPVLRQEIAEMR